MSPSFVVVGVLCVSALTCSSHGASWTLTEGANADGPGKRVEIQSDGRTVARFIHGDGQMKPYLHLLGELGELLTNGGLDAGGQPAGRYPHHRGIFIGWNRIASDLGTFDLWHFNNGGRMEVLRFEKLQGGGNDATLTATIAWRAGKKDDGGSDLLLTETRTLRISRPAGGATQVDAHFRLEAARGLTLGGDLQHAGIHFRAANDVALRANETSYLSDPADKDTKGRDWKPGPPRKDRAGNETKPARTPAVGQLNWCRLRFPIGDRWYAATQINAPSNPVEELSWRDYGRFGYFFKRTLAAGETLDLDYRFIVERAEAPAQNPQSSADSSAKARAQAQARHEAFVKSLRP